MIQRTLDGRRIMLARYMVFLAIGEIADGSQISERNLKRILSQYGLRLDARKTGPPDCHTKALVPATRRDVSVPMGAASQEAEVVHGAGPIFGRPMWVRKHWRGLQGRGLV
jgi:hypothetical protein